MAIRNRKGQTLDSSGQVPKRKPGRPKKSVSTAKTKKASAPRQTKPVIDQPMVINGQFHEVFPFHLQYKEDKVTKNCYFQCQAHMDKHIERYNLKKSEITIGATEPRTN